MRLALLLLAACSLPTGMTSSPPPRSLLLHVPGLVPGSATDLRITGAAPGAVVYIGVSIEPPGPGPCPDIGLGLCLDLVDPTFMGTSTADAHGEATFSLMVPDSLPIGTALTLQAMSTWTTLTGARAELSPALQEIVFFGVDEDGAGVFFEETPPRRSKSRRPRKR